MSKCDLSVNVESELVNAVLTCRSCGKVITTGEVCDTYPDNYLKTVWEDMSFIDDLCECGYNSFDIKAVVKINFKPVEIINVR